MAQLILSLHNRELQRVPIDSVLTTIGRDVATDLVIDNVGVSRVHARIDFDGRHFVVSDCDSRNGITVNGERKPTSPLREGDVIGINKFLVQFSLSGGVPPQALQRPERGLKRRSAAFQQTMSVDRRSAARISESVQADIQKQRAAKANAQIASKRRELQPSSDPVPAAPMDRRERVVRVVLSSLAVATAILAAVVIGFGL